MFSAILFCFSLPFVVNKDFNEPAKFRGRQIFKIRLLLKELAVETAFGAFETTEFCVFCLSRLFYPTDRFISQ